jgi:hypothetical protein
LIDDEELPMHANSLLGLEIPDAGWLFYSALVVHIGAALSSLIAGILAATARKRPGRHPSAGRVYLVALAVVCASATVMSTVRWREDARLFVVALLAGCLGLFGWRARRRRREGWEYRHAIGMGGSFILLFTGFYVDNGPQLPLWRLLPHWVYWTLPTAIGVPLIWLALRRFQAGISTRPRADGPTASSPEQLHSPARRSR